MIESNKLIAEFMGYEYIPFNNPEKYLPGWWNIKTKEFIKKLGNCYKLPYGVYLGRKNDSLCYHSSYDWLFPVLEKIKSLGCVIEIVFNFDVKCRICKINPKSETINIFSEFNGIEGVYDCVIQFIKLYNEERIKE